MPLRWAGSSEPSSHCSSGVRGSAVMNSVYGQVQGQTVVTSQTGSVDEPNYKGTITATLSDYTINPQLDDSIFDQGS